MKKRACLQFYCSIVDNVKILEIISMFQLGNDLVNCDISIIQNTLQKFKIEGEVHEYRSPFKGIMLNRKKKDMLQNDAYNI